MNKIEIHFCCYEDKDFSLEEQWASQKWQELGGFPLKAYSINAVIKKELSQSLFSEVFLHSVCSDYVLAAEEVAKRNPDVLIFCYYDIIATWMINFLKYLRKVFPKVKIIINNHAHIVKLEEFPSYCDIILNGDPEQNIIKVLTQIFSKQKVEGKGIITKNSKITIADPADLSLLPSPFINTGFEKLFLPENNYILGPPSDRAICYETQRGCPHSCFFCVVCSEPQVSRKKFAQIKEDFFYLKAFNIKTLMLLDPLFFINKAFSKKILRLFRTVFGEKVELNIQTTAEALDEEIIQELSKITCQIGIGLQTTKSRTIKQMHRFWNQNLFEKNISLLNQYKIPFYIDLIPGLPGEDALDFQKSFDYAFSLYPNYVGIHILFTLKNSAFYWKYLNSNKWFLHKKWGTLHELESNDEISKEKLTEIKQTALVNEFLFPTTAYIESRRFILSLKKSPWEVLVLFKRFLEEKGYTIDKFNTMRILPKENLDIEKEWRIFLNEYFTYKL